MAAKKMQKIPLALYWGALVAISLYGAQALRRWHDEPANLPPDLQSSWWAWFDQGRYLQAAQALAAGNLSPAHQWYEPGYALLAAPFVALARHDPFLGPNVACYVLCGVLSGMLGRRLLDAGRWGGVAGSLSFVVATTCSVPALQVWATPWTTTPVAVLILATLVAVTSFTQRPRPLTCFAAALCAGTIALFRPTDVVVAGVPAALAVLWVLVRGGNTRKAAAHIVGAGLAGTMIGLGAALGLHVAIWNWSLGGYLAASQSVGFAPDLIALRWVMLVLGPRPLLAESIGLAAVFPWMLPGMAGMVACLIAPGRTGRAPHLIVVGAAVLQCLILLAYRDLHPTGLWHYFNYHYFKWVIALSGLYSLVFLRSLLDRDRRLAAFGAVVIVSALSLWRPTLSLNPDGMAAALTGPHQLTLLAGSHRLSDAILVAARGPRDDIVMGSYSADGAERLYAVNEDFKAYIRPGGLLLVPLRPLPAGLRINFLDSITFEGPPIAVTQQIVPGLPCWFRDCPQTTELPPQPLALGTTLVMNSASDTHISGSWEWAAPLGRWLQAPDGAIAFRLTGWRGEPLMLRLRGIGYPPRRHIKPLPIEVSVNDHTLGVWQPSYTTASDVTMAIPSSDVGPDGQIMMRFDIGGRHSLDFSGRALLGERKLFVNSLAIEAAASP